MDVPPDDARMHPFTHTVDPDIFYRSPIHESACAEIFAAAKTHAGLLVLTGEPGTGKTIVSQRVARDLEQTGGRVLWLSDVLPLQGMFPPLDGVPGAPDAATPASWREMLLAMLQARVRSDDATVVVVDEAQRLEPAELGVLRDLAEAGREPGRPLAVLLVGQPELEVKLACIANDRPGPAFALRALLSRLETSDVRAYIAYRLEQAGLRLDDVFEAEAVERVAAYAEGIPRVINQLCHAALHGADEAGLTVVSASTIDAAATWLDLPRPGEAPRGGAWRATGRRIRAAWTVGQVASTPAAIRAWSVGAGIVALVLGAMGVFVSLRPVPQPPSPPPQGPAPAAVRSAEPHPVASGPGVPTPSQTGQLIERGPPSTTTRRVERPLDPGRKLASEPSVGGARRGTPPRVVSVAPAAPLVRRGAAAASALLDSAEAGNLAEVRALVGAGASPNTRDAAGMTPLMMAAIHNHGAVADFLLGRGADVNARDDGGGTALMLAANNGRAALIERLLARGANVNAQTRSGWTALIYAAWKGHPAVVRRLLQAGADPVVIDRKGWTALQYATWRAAEVSRAGTPDPADPSAVDDPASAAAAHLRYIEVIDLLGRATRPR